ncbi:serpin-Z2A-like [Aegilops tauschii subsp. strangulata]|nr:serpin-Z2A-like [Aegilops tauschii subsp. strangulata]
MEFAHRCFAMLARWLCPGADDDHAAIARRLGMLPELDHDDTLPLWAEAQKAMKARAEARNSLEPFALRLNKRLADHAGRSGNLLFSPLSVYVAFSMAAAGAREQTLGELLDALGAPSQHDLTWYACTLAEQALADQSRTGGPCVSFACGVWHHTTMRLRRRYRVATVWDYKAVTRAVNFHQEPKESMEQINAWVVALTNGLIPSIVDGEAPSHPTDLVLVNAMYFKGQWNKTFFDKARHLFHRLDRTAVDAPFMRGFGAQRIACHDGFKVLQLRYKQGTKHRLQGGCPLPALLQPPAPIYSMCVFLPDAPDGLWRLIDMIVRDPEFLRKHLPRSDVEVGEFRLPKLKVSFGMTMNGILRGMGLKEAFEPGKADLSDMTEDGARESRRLEQVVHRAIIEVNEEGTEATAATMVDTCLCTSQEAAPPPPPPPLRADFVADHPFAFFVIEEVSGAILFAGHVLDPTIK